MILEWRLLKVSLSYSRRSCLEVYENRALPYACSHRLIRPTFEPLRPLQIASSALLEYLGGFDFFAFQQPYDINSLFQLSRPAPYLFVAIDRTSKFAYAGLQDKATRRIATDFVHRLVEIVPYKIHTILTDNGTQFTELADFRKSVREKTEIDNPHGFYLVHAFDYACERHGIEHRLTKPKHPWTNGQVERMNRTIKEASVIVISNNFHKI